MHFEISDLIGKALQQEPISEYLSFVFGIYERFRLKCGEDGQIFVELKEDSCQNRPMSPGNDLIQFSNFEQINNSSIIIASLFV